MEEGRGADADDLSWRIVRADRRRVGMATAAAVLLAVLSAALLTRSSRVAVVIGIVDLCLFGLGAVVLALMLLKPPIVVCFGKEGVVVPTGLRRRREPVIPWQAINALRLYRFRPAGWRQGQRMIGLVPQDPDAETWASRRSYRLNARLTGLPVSISGQLIGIDIDELVAQMRLYAPRLGVENWDAGGPNGPLFS